MIHFNFTVSEEDAENIFGCIQSAIASNHECIMVSTVKGDSHDIPAYQRDILYLKELMASMKNKAVEVAPPDLDEVVSKVMGVLDGTYTPAPNEKSLAAEVFKELDATDIEIITLQRRIHG